jgi:Trk K+ transport system NAD-binding subunit
MVKQSRLARYYLIAVVGTISFFTLSYNFGMAALENRPQPLLNSLEVVFQTFTTVGYGEDAPWTSPLMNILVIGMQTTGILLIFASLPIFVIPLIEDALTTTPSKSNKDLHDHVIICTYTERSDALISELTDQDIDYVIVEPDRETAITLYERGTVVIEGDPESTETLQNARVDTATALVADASDEVNVSIILAAQEAADDIHTISVVDNPSLADYHEFAGADRVLSPNRLLGQRLAGEITSTLSLDLGDIIELDEDFRIVEVPIQSQSTLVGQTRPDRPRGEQTGAALVGAWFGSEFTSPIPSDAVLNEETTLLAVGREPQLEQLKQLTESSTHRSAHKYSRVVVAGLGEVGSAVTDTLSDAEIPWTGLDIVDKSGVDIICDATNPDALLEADIDTAHTVVLALPDDTEAVFATLLIRELNPAVEIIARANNPESVPKLYRAGADSVLTLATVSGQMIAADFLPEESMTSGTDQTQIVHTKAEKLVGQTLAESKVRTRTGVTVIAVERDGEILTGIDPSFTIREGDAVLITGTQEEINQFRDFVE